jgi:uncharacterized protein YdeI (BOF family)
MKKQVRFWWFLSSLVLFLSVGISLSAQQTAPRAQSQDQQSQQPAQPPQAQPGQTQDQDGQQTPDAEAQSEQSKGSQTFTGTIVKAGDKYVFQDEASGNTYDIDHQDEVQKFEGKKVKVHGKLDASGKMIHLQ